MTKNTSPSNAKVPTGDLPQPATMREVFSYRPFLLMWTAVLLSGAGTVLFLIVVAGRVFGDSGSALKASSVFTAQWLLPLLLAAVTGWIVSRFRIRNVLIIAELGSGVVSLLCALAFDTSFELVFGLLMLRGFFEGLAAPSRMVALKQYLPPHILEKACSIYGTSKYMSAAVGSLVGAVLAERSSLLGVALIDVATFVGASALYYQLGAREPSSASRSAGSWTMAVRTFRAHPNVLRNSLYLFIVCGAFQGFHNVAKTVLPMGHLGLGISGMTYLQLVTSAGLLSGAFFVFRFMTSGKRSILQHPLLLLAVTAVAMPLPFLTRQPLGAFALYFLFIFSFEVAYTRIENALIVECPGDGIGYVSAINMSIQTTLMALVIWGGSFLTDMQGPLRVATIMGLLATLLGILVWSALRRFQSTR